MPAVQSHPTAETNGRDVLYETKPFQQARERSFLHWPADVHPCRMNMKDAGWFIVRTVDDQRVAVCLYCQVACRGWTAGHDPSKVHRLLSPECVFVQCAHGVQTPPPSPINSVSRRHRVQPSRHHMAMVPRRVSSFEQWPLQAVRPAVDALANSGLFYNGQNTTVECFSCQGQRSITREDDDLMAAHTNRCKYAGHLRDQITPNLNSFSPSEKTYAYETNEMNNVTFYYLQCQSDTSPGILLSVRTTLSNEQAEEISQTNWKRLHPTDREHRGINRMTSSDGPLVHILQELAANSICLTNDVQYLTDEPSQSRTDPLSRCKTCLLHDTLPHSVSIKCRHVGPCVRHCYSKWSTCIICGYTLGRSLGIYHT